MHRADSTGQKRSLVEAWKTFFWQLILHVGYFKGQKKVYSSFNEDSFLSRRICSMHFLMTPCIWKMMLRVQVIVWYKSEHPTTRRNNSVAGESSFCRFLRFHTPKQPEHFCHFRGFLDELFSLKSWDSTSSTKISMWNIGKQFTL